jgi:hypothetical protein
VTDLPDFHIPHLDKIEWMIEENGWAIEPVAAQPGNVPPIAGYIYTIGFPQAFDFPEVVLFGLQPVAARGLFDLVADLLGGGTEIPLGVELAGLFDNDLRCVFAPVDLVEWRALFATGVAWHRGAPFDVVQLLWPDRNGFLPSEPGFDHRLILAQPLIGRVSG